MTGRRRSLVHGVGVNDAEYPVRTNINGEKWACPFYQRWANMIERCYGAVRKTKHNTYDGCSVCADWLTFSGFKSWMESQNWKEKELDKDLLFFGNKIYSPETCIFVEKLVNSFVLDSAAARGKHPIGVTFHKARGRFKAQCANPFTKKNEYLGLFVDPIEAHLAWKKRKHELATQLANTQIDSVVIKALITRFL